MPLDIKRVDFPPCTYCRANGGTSHWYLCGGECRTTAQRFACSYVYMAGPFAGRAVVGEFATRFTRDEFVRRLSLSSAFELHGVWSFEYWRA